MLCGFWGIGAHKREKRAPDDQQAMMDLPEVHSTSSSSCRDNEDPGPAGAPMRDDGMRYFSMRDPPAADKMAADKAIKMPHEPSVSSKPSKSFPS
jgi:hypothetical protein